MKNTLTMTVATSALLAGLAPFGAAAEEIILLDDITVSANLEETSVSRSGASVEIVTEEDLQEEGDTRATDVLARVPGVAIRTRGPLGTQAGIVIRGVPQTNIGVRVNGIDVSDPSGTQVAYDFGGLTTLDIGRIEILKGAQSAVYGSEAIGGVIDITTKRASKQGVEHSAALEFGSYDTVKGAYSFAAMGERGELAFTLSHIKTDGFSAAEENDGNTEADGYESNRFSFYGDYDLTDSVTVVVTGFLEDAAYDWDEGGPVDGSPDERADVDSRGLRTALQFTTGAVDHEVSAALFRNERLLTGSNAWGAFAWNYKGERDTLAYQGATDLGQTARLVFGAEHVKETYTADFGFGASSYDSWVNSAYAELGLAPNGQTDITATLRYDDHSEFGSHVSGRLAAVYRAREDLLFRATLANGFRAPSPYELYDRFSGNAALDPETSISAEIGVEKRYGDQGAVKLTAFYTEVEDLIDYSFTTFGYVQRDGTLRRKGVELSGAWDFGMVAVDAAYTYTARGGNVMLDSSAWLATTPRHTLALGLSADVTERLGLNLSALHGADRPGMSDYTVVNAGASFEVQDGVEAYLRVENLFDKEYQTVPGYGTSDRAAFIGVRAKF